MPNSRAQQMSILQNKNKWLEAELERKRAPWKLPAAEKRLEHGDSDLMHTIE